MYLTIGDALNFLLPRGSRGKPGCFKKVPLWPLDLFAVVAYLAQQSDSHCKLLEHGPGQVGFEYAKTLEAVMDAGVTWRFESEIHLADYPAFELIHKNWAIIQANKHTRLCNTMPDELVMAILQLIAIADEASQGVGFYSATSHIAGNGSRGWIPEVFDYIMNNDLDVKNTVPEGNWYKRLAANLDSVLNDSEHANSDNEYQNFPPASACILIPDDRICVLPKSHTPRFGCTIRSLTHNLALHPSSQQVRSRWYNYQYYAYDEKETLNILIVPFPYEIGPNDFSARELKDTKYMGFEITQSWLQTSESISDIVEALLDKAIQERCIPDIIVLPELALNSSNYLHLLQTLAANEALDDIIVIAGVAETRQKETAGQIKHYHSNNSTTAFISDNEIQLVVGQKKHHRWKLDTTQVSTYGLSATLNNANEWWELSDISERSVNYHVFRNGACLATLICEDLARTDPCKASINATAPNLVFALLMDGPQIASRWPGRYALGLSDDPGCAVLTVTSLGLIERSNWTFNNARQTIALWGGVDGIRELDLPANKKALVLTIEKKMTALSSIDGRVDAAKSTGWRYKAHTAL